MLAHAAAFLAVSALVIVTPGQDTALTIRNTLARGRRGGVHTAAGVALGQLVWALAASAGLVALLRAWEPAFLALRIAGAVYLLYLGLTALRSALTRAREPSAVLDERLRTPPLVQGLLSNLGNPKMAVFFTSLLPQFAPHGSFVALFALGAVFCALTLTWLSGYALAVSRASELLRRSRAWRTIEALTGAVLVALGIRVAATTV
ncbi:MAG TPA: LysE family translocator [Gaiellaceae bacterium]|nr:LysE family translocator [Gaiellaceae bacterium]